MKIEPCPICNTEFKDFKFTRGNRWEGDSRGCYIVCPNCNYSTAWHSNDFDALEEWNMTSYDSEPHYIGLFKRVDEWTLRFVLFIIIILMMIVLLRIIWRL